MEISPHLWPLLRVLPHSSSSDADVPELSGGAGPALSPVLPMLERHPATLGSGGEEVEFEVACASLPFLFPPLLAVSVVRPMHKAITSKEKGKSRPGELCLDPFYKDVCHCHKYHFVDTVEKP